MMKEEEEEETLFDQEGLLTFKPRTADGDTLWCHKFIKTIVLSISFLALGLCFAIPGPTLLDLGEHVGQDVQHMSYIFTARSVGYLLGSLVGGIVFAHFDQQLVLFYTLVLTAVATAATPWCTALVTMAIMIAFQGLTMGILDTGGNVFCIRIWGKKSAPYMQALHFMFAIGAFIAPLLAKPFLVNEVALNTTANVSNVPPPFALPYADSFPPSAVDRRHPRFVRDAGFPDEDGNVSTSASFTSALNVFSPTPAGNVSASTVPSTTLALPPHHAKKPNSVVSSGLQRAYTDGKKAQKALAPHRDDQVKKIVDLTTTTLGPSTLPTSPLVDSSSESANETGVSVNVTQADMNGTDIAAAGSNVSTSETVAKTSAVPSDVTPTTTGTMAGPRTTSNPSTTNLKTATTTSTTTAPLQTTTVQKVQPSGPPAGPTQPSHDASGTSTSATAVTANKTVQGNSSESEDTTTGSPKSVSTASPKKPGTGDSFLNTAMDAVKHMTKIQFAYLIVGLLLFVNAILFLILHCQDRFRGKMSLKNSDLPAQLHKESGCFRGTMLSLLFLFFFLYVGMEMTLGGLLSTFAVRQMAWTKQQGAVLTAIFWGALAAGRGIAIFVARCFKPPCMLIVDLVLAVTGALILAFAVTRFPMSLYAGTLIIGLGMSSIFPTGISWADYYFPLTGKSAAVLVVGSALGEMIVPVTTGHLFAEDNHMFLMYVMLLLTVLSCVIYWIMQCIALKKVRFSGRNQGQFMPLQDEEENLAMDNLSEMAIAPTSSGYSENSHKRTPKQVSFKDVDLAEYDRLVDIDD